MLEVEVCRDETTRLWVGAVDREGRTKFEQPVGATGLVAGGQENVPTICLDVLAYCDKSAPTLAATDIGDMCALRMVSCLRAGSARGTLMTQRLRS